MRWLPELTAGLLEALRYNLGYDVNQATLSLPLSFLGFYPTALRSRHCDVRQTLLALHPVPMGSSAVWEIFYSTECYVVIDDFLKVRERNYWCSIAKRQDTQFSYYLKNRSIRTIKTVRSHCITNIPLPPHFARSNFVANFRVENRSLNFSQT